MACKSSTCTCTFRKPEDIREAIKAIDDAIQKESRDNFAKEKYGYNLANTFLKSGRELYHYRRVLARHYYSLVTCNESNLKCDTVSKLLKSANRVIDLIGCGKETPQVLWVDDKNLQSWVAANPNCVSREKWESCICGMIPAYTISVKNFDELCTLIFDLKMSLINCDIQAALKYKEIDCSISSSLKNDLMNHGVSPLLIKKAIDCGLSFKKSGGEYSLVGVNGVNLKFKDITGLDTGCLT